MAKIIQQYPDAPQKYNNNTNFFSLYKYHSSDWQRRTLSME